jgi:pantetheine-phosphate adenylyltransferase
MKALYPGSFDPLSLGHLDIIQRAAKIFDNVTVLICENNKKQERLTTEQRLALVKVAVQDLENVDVQVFKGLTVDYARENSYDCLLRGMRGAADFELELEMSQINNFLSGGIETVFLMTSPEHSFIRSSRVWEILEFGDAIDNLVPKNVAEFLLKNYR